MYNFISILFSIFLINSSILASEELILNSESTFNPSHDNRFSLLLGFNPNLQKSGDITNFTFSYGKRMENFWLDSNLLITNGVFNKMATNNRQATGLTDDQLFNTKSTMTTIGIGIGRESHYLETLLPFYDISELSFANATYNTYNESASGKSFTGPGMIAKFILSKKFSEYITAGPHFIYNLAVVRRVANSDTENSSPRSLTMSYLIIGFDFSVYL